jgi:ubiquinone/menaquinone biosynthesis C-methylase UbiE
MGVSSFNVERVVADRYSNGAARREDQLCCPVDYDEQYLTAIPEEILLKDYGCGDPSRFVREGETVLDLGSGTGKICFIASQIVGPEGKVIGVDMNTDMLALARRYRQEVGDRIGWHNVEFKRGRIQDLALDLDSLDKWLCGHPVDDATGLQALEAEQARLRSDEPMIADDSVNVIVSNCVLNLVGEEQKAALFPEMFRVLKRGGRVVISDIVADEEVPEHMKADPELWSGCISGALTETAMLEAFEAAGFYGIRVLERSDQPWRTVEGIEFRSVTVEAWKGKEGPCYETNKAVIYRGPWKRVVDDDGHVFRRGERSAVCEKTFEIMTREPYAAEFDVVLPREAIDPAEARPFDCRRTAPRHPRETKGTDYSDTTEASGAMCEGPDCC